MPSGKLLVHFYFPLLQREQSTKQLRMRNSQNGKAQSRAIQKVNKPGFRRKRVDEAIP